MIDQARLRELADDFGEDDLGDLIQAFLEETAEAVSALEGMVSSTSADERSAQFHFIKGCALNIGATQLADTCQTFEQNPDAFSDAEYRRIEAMFAEVQVALSGDLLKKSA